QIAFLILGQRLARVRLGDLCVLAALPVASFARRPGEVRRLLRVDKPIRFAQPCDMAFEAGLVSLVLGGQNLARLGVLGFLPVQVLVEVTGATDFGPDEGLALWRLGQRLGSILGGGVKPVAAESGNYHPPGNRKSCKCEANASVVHHNSSE